MKTYFHYPSRLHSAVRTLFILLISLTIVTSFNFQPQGQKAQAAGGTTYYIDCNGNDASGGKSPDTAWRSLAKANSAPLVPGDSLRFKRGCMWTGTINAYWNGTATAKIVIGAYGSGNLPKIQNKPGDLDDGFYDAVDVIGSYQIIDSLETTVVNPPVSTACKNNPIGFFVGFHFRNPNNTANGGSYNLLRQSKATHFMAGVHLGYNTHNNRIVKNMLTDNNVMQTLTPISVNATDDIGAWGVVLKGRNQEIAYNTFSNNNAICTFDTPPQGNSVELYEAVDNVIHHNISINDRDFSELGGSDKTKSDNNLFAYNLVISSQVDSHFIIVRGSGNMFGPTYHTKLYQNTVYYTGSESQGIVCGAGCSSDILIAKNNIIWAEKKAAFADAAFTEGNNIYWNSTGDPFVQFQNFNMSTSSKITNPKFVDPQNQNFKLQASSPAINAGMSFGWQRDLGCLSAPQGSQYDIGSYEYPVSTTTVQDPSVQFTSLLPLIVNASSNSEDYGDLTATCP